MVTIGVGEFAKKLYHDFLIRDHNFITIYVYFVL